MREAAKSVARLRESDLLPLRVYQFIAEEDLHDETWVREVTELPLRKLDDCLIGTPVRLANGTMHTALLSNLSFDANLNDHFLTLAIFRNEEERFDLARYHDPDFATRGPEQLAMFLGLRVGEVFPVRVELERTVIAGTDSFSAQVLAEPRRRLSRSELIALAVP